MATAKRATVIRVEQLGADTRLLKLATPEPLAFSGGQYLIVDSGLVLDSGKLAKRAYSLLSSDAEQQQFELAVKLIPPGVCSTFMHSLTVGSEFAFSGPWGKLSAHNAPLVPTLVLATDTGISAALGLVRSAHFQPLLSRTLFVWLRSDAHYFLPDAFVRERIPSACEQVIIDRCPAVGHPERLALLRERVTTWWHDGKLQQAFITGDGAVNYALLEDLVALGVPVTRDHLESFFNMPKKST